MRRHGADILVFLPANEGTSRSFGNVGIAAGELRELQDAGKDAGAPMFVEPN
jgi:hypothetical protein